MNRKTSMLVLMLGGTLLSTACLAKPPTATCRAHGQAALKAWVHGHDDQMNQYFAPIITSKVTPATWRAQWKQVQAKFGDFRHVGKLKARNLYGNEVLVARLDFAKGPQAMVVQCDDRGRITNFRLVPGSMIPGFVKSTPAPKPPGAVSYDIKVPTPLGPLPGTVLLPKGDGPFPAVVLVQGSGPLDRDETIGPNKPFRDIAMGLAQAGIATLRYDKRNYVYAEQMKGKPTTVDDRVTDDALTALHVLARQKHIDPQRIFVLGHSLGAMMAPRIGARDPHLAGVIMLAAPARPMLDVLAEQFRVLGKRQGASVKQIAKLEKGVKAERKLLAAANPEHPSQGGYSGFPQSFWLSLQDYDQVAVAKKLAVPMLILQGESDLNVSYTKDFPCWKKALAGHDDVSFHAYPGLSHLFMTVNKSDTMVDFIPGHVSSEVIDDIAEWIKAQPATSQ